MQSLSSLFSEVVRFRFFLFHNAAYVMCPSFLVALNSVAFYLQGKKADTLIKYFGEDPVRCPFEQGKEISFIWTAQFNFGTNYSMKDVAC